MAGNSFESDARHKPPSPVNVQHEPQTVDQYIGEQRREVLEPTTQQDFQLPTEDLGFRGMVTEENVENLKFLFSDIQAPMEDYELKQMLLKLSKELTDEDLEKLKFRFSGGSGNGVQENIKKPVQLFATLVERHWITRNNMIIFQTALRDIGRLDLVRVTAEFAQMMDNDQPSESVLPEMAGNSFESDARHKPPSPVNVQHEPRTVDQYIGEQRREVLEHTTQQDFQLPTEDLGFKGMVTEENVENLKFLFSDIQAPMEDYELKQMLLKLSKELTDEDLEKLKIRFSGGKGGLGKGVQEKIKKPVQLFTILEERHWLTRNNLLNLQAALRDIGRMDLVRVTVEYAQRMGYTSVRLHLWERNYNYDIQMIHTRFQELVGCAPEDIVIVGLNFII